MNNKYYSIGKLRNMTSVFLTCGDNVLLPYREIQALLRILGLPLREIALKKMKLTMPVPVQCVSFIKNLELPKTRGLISEETQPIFTAVSLTVKRLFLHRCLRFDNG